MRAKTFALALLAGSLVAPVRGSAQTLNGALAGAGTIPGLNANAAVKVLPVRGNIYMLVGAGANVTLSVGSDGILLVDTGSAQMTDKILTTIRQLANAVSSMPIPATLLRNCPP